MLEASLLEAAAALRREGSPAVLATLLAVHGSSVRRPGARLLILPDGRLAGFLSAGCVEQDLAARVEEVLSTGRTKTVPYDGALAADPVLGLGLGCGGSMTVLLERWPPPSPPDPLEIMEGVARTRRPAALATLVAPPESAGLRLAVSPEGDVVGAAPPDLSDVLEEVLRQERPGLSEVLRINEAEIFVERLEPPLRLLVQGSTQPALALARLAPRLGWETVVLPVGAGTDTPAVPPEVRALPPGDGSLPAGFELDRWTVAALLAHDTAAEARLAPVLLAGGVPYVGVMGSRSRRDRLIAALGEGGLPESALERLHMPIGLDLGAESAAEIALAAAAEILAALRGRGGGALSTLPGPIHGH